MFTSCAHIRQPLTPRQLVSSQISEAFVRVHISVSYEIKQCHPKDLSRCREIGLGITGPAGIGSGGVISHNDESSSILTATHVVSSFGQIPPSHPDAIQGVIRAYARITGTSLEIARLQFQSGALVAEGIETIVSVATSNGKEYRVNSIDCHPVHDVCMITTASRIEDVPTLSVSSTAPSIGDEVRCAQGPFGYAIPGMMVPLFDGVYSGQTPRVRGSLAKDYYTFPVAPGSSGSLIVNTSGQIVGIVSMFMSGPFCADNGLGCHAMSSGITVSIPYNIVRQFIIESLSTSREEN
jgi:S1-C subfamily serine protease